MTNNVAPDPEPDPALASCIRGDGWETCCTWAPICDGWVCQFCSDGSCYVDCGQAPEYEPALPEATAFDDAER